MNFPLDESHSESEVSLEKNIMFFNSNALPFVLHAIK